jgi:hypothetical protein
VAIASLHHDDWANICQALGHDLVKEQVAEVQLRALELIAVMPELHVEHLMDEGKLEDRLLAFVEEVHFLACRLALLWPQAYWYFSLGFTPLVA